jgi:hypothetical protein
LFRMAFLLPCAPHLFHLVNLAGPGDVGRPIPEDTVHRRHRPLSVKHPPTPTPPLVLQNCFPFRPILLYSSDYPKWLIISCFPKRHQQKWSFCNLHKI